MGEHTSEDRPPGGPPEAGSAPERLHWVTPVFRAVLNPDGQLEPRDVVGTSFPLGGDLMLTASHVVRAALHDGGRLILARPQPGRYLTRAIEGRLSTDWPEVDLAAIHAPGIGLEPATWDASHLRVWEQIKTIGFPFGLDHSDREVTIRGLVGHISTMKRFKTLAAKPWVYETTFQAPRGLSGAPLLVENGAVAGCIVGNEQSFMEVSFQEEEVTGPPGRIVERRVEGIYYAVAISAAEILRLRSSPAATLEQHILAYGGHVMAGPVDPPRFPRV